MDVDKGIAQAFRGIFDVDVDDDMSILTLEEWDSLAHVTLIMELEVIFNITIADWEAIEATSVSSIREILIKRGKCDN